MTHSEQLFERAKQLIPGGVNSPVRAFRSVGGTPFFVTAANGAMLTTADGRELIDFCRHLGSGYSRAQPSGDQGGDCSGAREWHELWHTQSLRGRDC